MGCSYQQAAYGYYDCLVPAGNKHMARNNDHKPAYQQKHREQTMPPSDISNANSTYTYDQGECDHAPFKPWV